MQQNHTVKAALIVAFFFLQSITGAAVFASEKIKSGFEKAQESDLPLKSPEAILAYTRLIQAEPENASAYFFRGKDYASLGLLDKAMSDFTKAISLDEKKPQFYIQRGFLQRRLGKEQEAIDEFGKAIALNPDSADAYCDRAMSFCNLKKYLDALADWDQYKKLRSQKDFFTYSRIETLASLSRYEEALQEINIPPSSGSLGRLSPIRSSGKPAPQIADAYERAKKSNTSVSSLTYSGRNCSQELALRGRENLAIDEDAQAVDDFTAALNASPENHTVGIFKVFAHFRLGQFSEAIQTCKKMIAYNAEDFEAHLLRGLLYLKLKQNDAAIKDLNSAVALRADDRLLYFYRALAFYRERKNDESITDFETFFSLSHLYDEVHVGRLLALEHLDRHPEAMKECDMLLKDTLD